MEPFGHIAHKDGHFGGVIAHDCGVNDTKLKKAWKKEVSKFCGDFIADGYTITTFYTRDEYLALLKTLDTSVTS
ncbi:MAG: hypothetical protein AB7G35_15080 [Hyphomicrobiaceae bacterium]